MEAVTSRVAREMAGRKLWPDNGLLLVGVSGGVDSMVLLNVLHKIAPTLKCAVVAAHLNHLLRGPAANADQKLVERTARELGVRVETAAIDVRKIAKEQGVSIEMAARKARHDFLARTARNLGIQQIALAHHAGDQVETFLLRLLRGAGTIGLGGMEWKSASPADKGITVIRPLLGLTKAELVAFAHSSGMAFRDDKSNASKGFLRNRVRLELLPLLRRHYQPGIDSVLLREVELLRADAEFITAQARAWMSKGKPPLHREPVALQRRVIQLELQKAGIAPDFQLVERLREAPGSWISVAAGLCCRLASDDTVEVGFPDEATFRGLAQTINTAIKGEVTVNDTSVAWSHCKGSSLPHPSSRTEYFDAEKVGVFATIRHWQPGDRLQPIGMSRAVKLQDLFTNEKIARHRRHALLVATAADGGVFWVEDLRISERYKVTKSTRRMLKWSWSSAPKSEK